MSRPPISVGFNWDVARIAYRRRLPHVVQANTIYFITFRLADSVPRLKLDQWSRELERWKCCNPLPHTSVQQRAYAELGYRKVERWLDRGEGCCILKEQHLRAVVEDCLRFDDGESYWLGDFVIMPNHVHALVKPAADTPLRQTVSRWRTVSTQRINKLTDRRGTLWQADWFDHITRDHESLARIHRYIQDNGRRLPPGQYTSGSGLLFQ